jgi:Flp pilus assembly protein TadG
MSHPTARFQRGQTLVIFALMLPVLLMMAGLVVDVGYAFGQQRTAQNASDFSALAGARILGEFYTGNPAGAGTDANVNAAVNSVLAANHATRVSAEYVDMTGTALGAVGGGNIPSGAAGVVVSAKTVWHTFFLGIIGVSQWTAGVTSTAVTKGVPSAGVMPLGVNKVNFAALPYCDPLAADFITCIGGSPGSPSAKIQGGFFGWLAFGAPTKGSSKCNGFGLGMIDGGCDTSQKFLDSEIGPPINSYGCCTQLDPTALNNFIGQATGNMPADFSAYINPAAPVIVWVPIYDYAVDHGAGGYYHIVGFGAIVIVGADTQHGEWVQAVRVATTYGDSPNGELLAPTGAVYLVH